ncbi:uncharacterized protein [Primulina eburnea]|uniref:uncharacterized protein n=1 Tax=Primulina eburnea TaxID=1245227 RepID=UPI003C6C933A
MKKFKEALHGLMSNEGPTSKGQSAEGFVVHGIEFGSHRNTIQVMNEEKQTDFEQLYDAWERYKELLRRCSNHGFEDWVQIELFYNGLNGQTLTTMDAAAGGTIFAKSLAQAYDLLEQMSINSYQWPSERSGVKRTAGVYAVDPTTSLTAQFSALTTQIATMNKVSTSNTEGPPLVVEEPQFLEEVQYINNKNLGGDGGYQGKPSFEDLVGKFVSESGKRMSRTESRLDNLETHMASIGATLKILESQVGQITKKLTSQPSGAIQKTADPNLREVNAIFIHHEEIGIIEGENKKIDRTPSRDYKPTPSKGTESRKRWHLMEEMIREKQGNLPQKLQDPGEFVVPCEIGGKFVEKTICDSGGSANIMSNSLYKKLGLSRIKPTGLSLQMADKAVRTPLGRPFLATARAVIDSRQGKLTMEVDGQSVELKASKKSYDPPWT